MFLGASKRVGRNGLRLGFGLRVTKRNFFYMSWILMFAAMFHLLWIFMKIGAVAMYYMMVWPFIKLYQKLTTKNQDVNTDTDI